MHIVGLFMESPTLFRRLRYLDLVY